MRQRAARARHGGAPGAAARAAAARPAPRAWPELPGAAVLGLVLLAAAWLQRTALRAPFFADDFLFLDQARNHSLWGALTGADPIGNFVRPVGRQLHFWLLARAGGESALVFHLANLALFLGVVALLFIVTRRLAGGAAAAVAAAFVALHYAADVPLLWASGSQDLLALAGALGALALFLSGRRVLAALALLAGLLSKETVLFTPLVAALAARRAGESWRRSLARAWPLGLAALLWAALWLAVAAHSAQARHAVAWNPGGVVAAFVHLAQVAAGLEWRQGGALRILTLLPPLVPLALALAAVALAGRRAGERAGEPAAPAVPPVVTGLAWALLGALPVTAVAAVWSAYFYLFALCGVGLALGAWLARRSRSTALVAVALLAWGSESGRRLDEFITVPGAWTTQSHVNRRYVERGTGLVARYLRQLRAARPTLPPRSTVFFGGLPSFVGFQVGDGPLVRWAYRDSSLRSYYLLQFTAGRYRRGPAFAYVVRDDSLQELPLDQKVLRTMAMTALISDRPRMAVELLDLPAAQGQDGTVVPYWRSWARLALGDTSGAFADLRAAGMTLDAGPAPEADQALRAIGAQDTAGARLLAGQGVMRHVLDPVPHQLLGGLLINAPETAASAAIEAFAATRLAPGMARPWWLLGYAQAKALRHDEAVRSLDRFFALGGGYPEENAEARSLLDWLRARGPGGERFQQSLRGGAEGSAADH